MMTDLPDGWIALETVTIIKALDEEGSVRLWHSATDGLNTWEAAGMCIRTLDVLRKALADDS
jgi:hypothetical protein